jgi:two-component system, OmpR family, copper resistance phosphate regulon response regulator CusR
MESREDRMARVLVIEDQKTLLQNLVRGLSGEGYQVVGATTGEEAGFEASSGPFDVIVLDLMLPGKSGLDVLRELRAGGSPTPVLILTARDSIDDRVLGLDSGADDYLVKPFAFAELLARLRVLLRRGASGRETVLRAADLEMDLVSRRVARAGKIVELTTREFELLEYLLRHKGEPATRDMLSREVWKEATGATTNVIDVYINALRKKVERSGSTPLIHTVRGVGYVLKESP